MPTPKRTMDPSLTTTSRKKVARHRMLTALQKIEQAQHKLDECCQELCAINGGARLWRKIAKLSEQVKAAWYALDEFMDRDRYGLDHDPKVAVRDLHKLRSEAVDARDEAMVAMCDRASKSDDDKWAHAECWLAIRSGKLHQHGSESAP